MSSKLKYLDPCSVYGVNSQTDSAENIRYHNHRSKDDNKQQASLQQETQGRNLCSTCENNSTCTFPKDPDRPVLYCELFDDGRAAAQNSVKDPSPLSLKSSDKPDEEQKRFTGLCSNCENRWSCSFPKAEGGIWHCEEYR